jgi:hypothetical protein
VKEQETYLSQRIKYCSEFKLNQDVLDRFIQNPTLTTPPHDWTDEMVLQFNYFKDVYHIKTHSTRISNGELMSIVHLRRPPHDQEEEEVATDE